MAKFTAVQGLDQLVAIMVAPEVRRQYADKVVVHARATAPPTKTWVNVGDNNVRHTHRDAPGRAMNQDVPDNLRFELASMVWDRVDEESNHLGAETWMMHPRDWTSGAVANILNCRCVATYDKTKIARTIRAEPTKIVGAKVSITVSATGNRIVASEFGEPYTGGRAGVLKADGLHWMAKAARMAAAR